MFVAYLVSYTGTAMAPIAMTFGVLELTGSAADAAFVIAAPTAASILVLLLDGLLGMQLRPRHPMYVASYCKNSPPVGIFVLASPACQRPNRISALAH